MIRPTEVFIKAMQKYLDEHQDELDNGADEKELIQRFTAEYNAAVTSRDPASEPETADEYLELAQGAATKKQRLNYLNKAAKLEPENLDVVRLIAETKATSFENLLKALSDLIKKATAQLEEEGYFKDDMGDFWLIIETRPYMRLLYSYMSALIQCGMFRLAIDEAENMLRLCQRDNLGVRSTLMCLYAYFEDEDEAKQLDEKFGGGDCQMTLPLAVLYYKKQDFAKSRKYLRRLTKENKDTKKFFRAVVEDDMARYLENAVSEGYRMFSIEEFIYTLRENDFLYMSVTPFFDWAHSQLKKVRD